MYNPQDFDAHPSFNQPMALQPGAIVAYKLDTRIRDVWVLTVALNSCPTLGKSHKKPHHLQLQTLQTVYDFEEDNNRIITYPANETYQLEINFNKTFDFDPNQLRLVYQEVDINKLNHYHSPVYTNGDQYWIDPNKELFTTQLAGQHHVDDIIECPHLTLKYPLLVRPRNQEPSRFGDQLSPYYLHDKELTLFAYSSTSYRDPWLNLNRQDMQMDSNDDNKNDPDVIHFQSVNNH